MCCTIATCPAGESRNSVIQIARAYFSIDIMVLLERVNVVYCGACGMPPEYCEYGPDYESHCLPWLLKNHPLLYAKLKALRGDSADPDVCAPADEKPPRPTEPWTTEQRLVAFYEQYEPEKVKHEPRDSQMSWTGRNHFLLFIRLGRQRAPVARKV